MTGSIGIELPRPPLHRAPAPAREPERLELPYARETARRADEAKAPPPKPKVRRFARVVVQDTGTVVANKITIRFTGIEPLALEDRCGAEAQSWPCGRAGRGALRRLIRGRTIACEGVTETGDNEITGRCSVASIDINEWLVRYGWAKPRSQDAEPYGEALKTARQEGRGQWRQSRAGAR